MTSVIELVMFAFGALLFVSAILNWDWIARPRRWPPGSWYIEMSEGTRRIVFLIYGAIVCIMSIVLMTGILERPPAQDIPLKIVSTNMPVWQGHDLEVNIQTESGCYCYYIIDPEPPQTRDTYFLRPRNTVDVDSQGQATITIKTDNLTKGTHFLSIGVSKGGLPSGISGVDNPASLGVIHAFVYTDFVVN